MSTKQSIKSNSLQRALVNYWHPERASTHSQIEVMSEINMTPLIDVMLVLLIVFMITLPAIHQAIQVDLPKTTSQHHQTTTTHSIDLTIDASGKIYWDQTPVDLALLEQKMQAIASQEPDLQLRADRATRYEYVAEVMAMAQKNGLNKLSVITEPHLSKR